MPSHEADLEAWIAAGGQTADWTSLVSHQDAVVRARVASNPWAPWEEVARLSEDHRWFVRLAALSRPEADPSVRNAFLSAMAAHSNESLRMLVAADPQAPAQSLQALSSEANDEVRQLISSNPGASDDMRDTAALMEVNQFDEDAVSALRTWASVTGDGGRRGVRHESVGASGSSEVWRVSDVGPGGGTVFFDAGERQWWGRYLEVAPAGWWHPATDGAEVVDPGVIWCPGDMRELDVRTEYAAGWGLWNTWRIIEAVGPASAAWVAASYRGGGYTDWCLASFGELAALCRSSVVDGLANDQYWSSSQREIDTQDEDIFDALCINFADRDPFEQSECDPEDLLEIGLVEHLDVTLKDESLLIRPVRAF